MKSKKVITLNRETLQKLDDRNLQQAAGMQAVTRLRSQCETYYATYCPALCR
jgi:hypothetical protein